jgi:hypothetical protein
VIVNPVLMLESNKVTVNINDKFAVQRNAISGLILLSDTFWKQPVQNGKVNVHGLEFPTVELQVMNVQAVLEFVELDEPAFTQLYPEVFSTQVPEIRHHEGSV